MLNVGWFYLADADDTPLQVAACLDVAGSTPALRSPGGLLRVYEEKTRPEPTTYARKVYAWHRSHPGLVYQLANEANLVNEKFGGTADDYAAWVVDVHSWLAGVTVGVGAFSPGDVIPGTRAYSDVDGWRALRPFLTAAPAARAVFHIYAPTFVGLVASFERQAAEIPPHTKIVIGECNFGPGPDVHVKLDWWARHALYPFLDWLERTQPRVEALYYFAHRWPTPDPWFAGGTPVDGAGTEVERVLREWRPSQPASAAPNEAVTGSPAGAPAEADVGDSPMPETPTREALETLVRETATRLGVDPDLADALVRQESGYRVDAVSPAGARGLTQLMPATAAALGVMDPFDPVQNVEGGLRYLADKLLAYRGDVDRALVAFNGGHGAVQAWEAGDPYSESRRYVYAIRGHDLGPADPCEVQFGQRFRDSLTVAEQAAGWQSSACGPIALAGMLTRLGQPTAAVDVLRWAAEYRHPDGRPIWTAQHGMVGAVEGEAMETLAAGWGVALARHAHPTDFLDALSFAGGLISTPRHYFYVIRPSLSDNDLYVGNTGNALTDGGPWMTLGEIERVGGGILATWTGALAPVVVPAPVHPLTAAEDNVWAALSQLAALDQLRAEEAQRVFADVIKPVLARAKGD